MFVLVLASLAMTAHAATDHESANPLYRSLLDPGLPVGANATAKFPKPTMPDGLDAAKQTAIIKDLIKDDYSYAEFTRKSVVAPQLLKTPRRDSDRPEGPGPRRGCLVRRLWRHQGSRRREVPRKAH